MGDKAWLKSKFVPLDILVFKPSRGEMFHNGAGKEDELYVANDEILVLLWHRPGPRALLCRVLPLVSCSELLTATSIKW